MMQCLFWHLASLITASLRFIHVVLCFRPSFFFMAKFYSIVWIYHILLIFSSSIDVWVGSTLGKCFFEHLCISLFSLSLLSLFFPSFVQAVGLTGSYFADQGLNPYPQQWKRWVLSTGPPGNSRLSLEIPIST